MSRIEKGVESSRKEKENSKIEIRLGERKYSLENESIIGMGSEAVVIKGLLKGENIEIQVCRRVSHNPFETENIFFKHLICFLMDTYYLAKKEYTISHIPQPIGISEDKKWYLYTFAKGSEGFSWRYLAKDNSWYPRRLEEWGEVTKLFRDIGIGIDEDVCTSENADISKNIILEGDEGDITKDKLPKTWKRIDFGYMSVPIITPEAKERLYNFIKTNKNDLKKHLGEKFDLLFLAAKKLKAGLLNRKEEKVMQELLFRYQKEILEKPESEK